MAFRGLHIMLASLLIIGQSGLLINSHFCQGERKQAALFLDPGSCHTSSQSVAEHGMPASCPMHGKVMVHEDDNKGCCDDKSSFHKLDIDQLISKVELPDFTKIILDRIPVISLQSVEPSTDFRLLFYHPPNLFLDLAVMLQVFRL